MAGLILFSRPYVEDNRASSSYPLLQFREGHWLQGAAIVQKCLHQAPDFRQSIFPQITQREPESKHVLVGQAIADIFALSSGLNELRLAQYLKVLGGIGDGLGGFFCKILHCAFGLGKELK